VVRQIGMAWHGMDFGVVGLRKRVGLGESWRTGCADCASLNVAVAIGSM
jgi:hypothetical protein